MGYLHDAKNELQNSYPNSLKSLRAPNCRKQAADGGPLFSPRKKGGPTRRSCVAAFVGNCIVPISRWGLMLSTAAFEILFSL